VLTPEPGWWGRWFSFRGGYTVKLWIPERRWGVKYRLPSRDAAGQRLQEAAEVIERDGVAVLY
jgi:hypothetical protein